MAIDNKYGRVTLIEMTREGPLADVIRAERQAQGNFREIGKE